MNVSDKNSCDLINHRLDGISLYDTDHDTVTKYEVPTRFRYTHTVTVPSLAKPQLIKPVRINEKHLLPGPSGVESTERLNIQNMKQYLNSVHTFKDTTDQTKEYLKVSNQGIHNLVSYPALLFGQPYVPDHTGVMKFKFFVRISTIMDTTITLKSDHYFNKDWRIPEQRQYNNWPSYELKPGQKDGYIMLYPYLI